MLRKSKLDSDVLVLTLKQFLAAANRRAQCRVMNKSDYRRYANAIRAARQAARKRHPFYLQEDAGGVANAYGYSTTTARWGVYVDPKTHKIVAAVGRVTIWGRSVSAVYYGGERAYHADWRRAHTA